MDIAQILSTVGFDWKMAIFNLVNFFVVFLVLKKYLFGKLSDSIDSRQEDMDATAKKAEEIEQRLANATEESKGIISEAKNASKEIIKKSHENAEKLANKMKQDTEKDIERMFDKSRKQTEAEKQQMIKDLRKETGELIVTSVEKLIKKNLNTDEDKKIVDELLDSLN